MNDSHYEFGMVGLGVMGRNLMLNIADHNFSVVGLDLDPKKVKAIEQEAGNDTKVKGTSSVQDFVNSLRTPRAIMLLVPAGKPVDAVLDTLVPLLQPGDIVIDGGNSYFPDTDRRVKQLETSGIHFFGMGISGGEKGARFGPSMMPGGNREAYERLRPVFEAVAAKVNGEPCVAFLGNGSAGNYVKMVHNGIEYGLMQLIAEAYDFLKRGVGLNESQLEHTFKVWNKSELQSFLIEITGDILSKKDDISGNNLVSMISDVARSKGTGKWTSQNAMDLQVPVPTIDTAVLMRDMSTYKAERVEASRLYPTYAHTLAPETQQAIIDKVKDALYFSFLMTYAQGLAQLRRASEAFDYDLNLQEVVTIWRGGCIIRAACLEDFRNAFSNNPELPNILLAPTLQQVIISKAPATREILKHAIDTGISMPGFMASLAYFDAYRSETLPTNLIQAQRDYFGAHTYERIDREGSFHTQWN